MRAQPLPLPVPGSSLGGGPKPAGTFRCLALSWLSLSPSDLQAQRDPPWWPPPGTASNRPFPTRSEVGRSNVRTCWVGLWVTQALLSCLKIAIPPVTAELDAPTHFLTLVPGQRVSGHCLGWGCWGLSQRGAPGSGLSGSGAPGGWTPRVSPRPSSSSPPCVSE